MLSAVHFVRRMSVFLLVFGYLWSPLRAETQVSCVFNESCVLPCSFQNGSDPVIHWFKTPGDDRVHSYYYDQDQVQHQDQDFKDRTSLFVDQISRGNASLLLREVRVQDEGTYKCFTSTVTSDGKNFFINLRVKASVSFVNIEQRGDELICSSKDIYPKPDVSWSLRPPPPDVEPKTSVSVSEKGLYSIFSSVPLSHKPPEEHSCNISTDHSWSSATYRLQLYSISGEVTVLCSTSNAPIKSLIWKFNQNQTILTQTGTNRVYNESWRQFVEEVSESGLTLKNLSSGHSGVYSCVLSSDRETLITNTVVRKEAPPDPPSTTVYIVVVVLLFLLFIITILVLFYRWKRQKDSERIRHLEGFIQKLKNELDSKNEKQELEDLLDSKVEETRAAEEIPPNEQSGENQQRSEFSQDLKRLRELEEENKQLKGVIQKLIHDLGSEGHCLRDFVRLFYLDEDWQEQTGESEETRAAEVLKRLRERIRDVEEKNNMLKGVRQKLMTDD